MATRQQTPYLNRRIADVAAKRPVHWSKSQNHAYIQIHSQTHSHMRHDKHEVITSAQLPVAGKPRSSP